MSELNPADQTQGLSSVDTTASTAGLTPATMPDPAGGPATPEQVAAQQALQPPLPPMTPAEVAASNRPPTSPPTPADLQAVQVHSLLDTIETRAQHFGGDVAIEIRNLIGKLRALL